MLLLKEHNARTISVKNIYYQIHIMYTYIHFVNILFCISKRKQNKA